MDCHFRRGFPLAEQVQLENKENPNVDIKVVVDTELKNVNEKAK